MSWLQTQDGVEIQAAQELLAIAIQSMETIYKLMLQRHPNMQQPQCRPPAHAASVFAFAAASLHFLLHNPPSQHQIISHKNSQSSSNSKAKIVRSRNHNRNRNKCTYSLLVVVRHLMVDKFIILQFITKPCKFAILICNHIL